MTIHTATTAKPATETRARYTPPGENTLLSSENSPPARLTTTASSGTPRRVVRPKARGSWPARAREYSSREQA